MYWFGDDLYNLYKPLTLEKSEIIAEVEFLADVVGNFKYKDYILGKKIEESKKDLIKSYIKKRTETGKPIQQIVGKAYFCGELFEVNEYTLIPRPETELITDCLKKYFSSDDSFNMLEIGIGTGCISIITAQNFKHAKITGVDICQNCVDISKKNALLQGVEDNVNFILSDVFENVSGKYDVIVSNPPYISYSDTSSVQDNVLRFEPHSALFAPNDGYYFYEKIITESIKYVQNNSLIIFEIGINQSKKIQQLLEINNYSDIKIIKDFNGIDRTISAIYNS